VDAHDRALLARVHPAEWRNPAPASRYHLVVVGAGTGGLVTAAIGAALGARVALVERGRMGGDCLNVGCVPSKAILRAGRAWQEAREAAERFGGPRAEGDGDFAAAMERMRRLRARISPVDSAARFRDELGVDVFLGEGRFTAPDALEVGGAVLRFRRAVIATGARAAAPPVPGLEEVGYLTNETVFDLAERPRRLLVLGAGPVGCELAQAFARLGSEVWLLDRGPRVLPREEADAAAVVQARMERDGVRILHSAETTRVERRGGEVVVHFTRAGEAGSVAGDRLLVAVGRAPNVEGLGLEAAAVEHGREGVRVDDRLRTSNPAIYAVGDICSRLRFTHLADAHARLAVQNALFFGRGKASSLVVPRCTYTSPELAHVGMTADEARAAGHEVETITVPLREVDRAVLDGEDDGFLRVHVRRGSDRILGATLVAEHAGEIITLVTQAMAAGRGLLSLGQAIYPYPTQAEVVRKAADALRRRKLTPLAKKGFDVFFRVFR
jgi:pyruvate/2-oxoglutarate dehydrogenase complex dihydrolipoamide dehydrogenase (E3) component